MAPERKHRSNDWSASKVFLPKHLSMWPNVKVPPLPKWRSPSLAKSKKALEPSTQEANFTDSSKDTNLSQSDTAKKTKIVEKASTSGSILPKSSPQRVRKAGSSFNEGNTSFDSTQHVNDASVKTVRQLTSSLGVETEVCSDAATFDATMVKKEKSPAMLTPSPSELCHSSKEKLKDAIRRHENIDTKKRSISENVLHARSVASPMHALNQVNAQSTALSKKRSKTKGTENSSATALEVAARNIQNLRLDLHPKPSNPPATLVETKESRPKLQTLQPAKSTTIDEPAHLRSPPVTPSGSAGYGEMDRDQKAAFDRIAQAYGKEFAEQHLNRNSITTFSSKIHQEQSESDTEHATHRHNVGNLKGESGWDVVLAEARYQAERLQARQKKIEKSSSPTIQGTHEATVESEHGNSASKSGDSSNNIKRERSSMESSRDGHRTSKREPDTKNAKSKKRKSSHKDHTDERSVNDGEVRKHKRTKSSVNESENRNEAKSAVLSKKKTKDHQLIVGGQEVDTIRENAMPPENILVERNGNFEPSEPSEERTDDLQKMRKRLEKSKKRYHEHRSQKSRKKRDKRKDRSWSTPSSLDRSPSVKVEESDSNTSVTSVILSNHGASLLSSLKYLIPEAVIQSSKQKLNEAEHDRISNIIKQERRAEKKRIKRHTGDAKPIPVWKGIKPDVAIRESLVEGAKLYHRNDPEVVLMATAEAIRAWSTGNVDEMVVDGEAGHDES